MKIQEVILRAVAKELTWWQAAEIIGISDWQMRRWHRRYEPYGYDGLYDRRRGQPSPRRVPLGKPLRSAASRANHSRASHLAAAWAVPL